jgi:hypothetical protein
MMDQHRVSNSTHQVLYLANFVQSLLVIFLFDNDGGGSYDHLVILLYDIDCSGDLSRQS